jgi:hypothetical protein
MEDVGIFYGHLVYFMAIWHILRFLVYLKVNWYILPVLVSCSKKNLATLLVSRVTRLGKFLPIKRVPSWDSVVKITEIAQIFGLLSLQCQLCINFDNSLIGLHFGRLFHKVIWSPCS